MPESARAQVESTVQPLVQQMPETLGLVVTSDAADIIACHPGRYHEPFMISCAPGRYTRVKWSFFQIGPGATRHGRRAFATVSQPWTSESSVWLMRQGLKPSDHHRRTHQRQGFQNDPGMNRRSLFAEASDAFNQGSFRAAATLFHALKLGVSGGQTALSGRRGELCAGIQPLEQFHYQGLGQTEDFPKALGIWRRSGAGPWLKSVLDRSTQQRIFRLVL